MTRRASLPGADELFRATAVLDQSSPDVSGSGRDALVDGDPSLDGQPGLASGDTMHEARSGTADGDELTDSDELPRATAPSPEVRGVLAGGSRSPVRRGVANNGVRVTERRAAHGTDRRPSGRERHDEKITVYVSAEEFVDLEHARLLLRAEHGLGVDRGRMVREALAVVLADLEAKGEASILVRRLRGR